MDRLLGTHRGGEAPAVHPAAEQVAVHEEERRAVSLRVKREDRTIHPSRTRPLAQRSGVTRASMYSAIEAMVGRSKSSRKANSIPNVWFVRETKRSASSEWKPIEKMSVSRSMPLAAEQLRNRGRDFGLGNRAIDLDRVGGSFGWSASACGAAASPRAFERGRLREPPSLACCPSTERRRSSESDPQPRAPANSEACDHRARPFRLVEDVAVVFARERQPSGRSTMKKFRS